MKLKLYRVLAASCAAAYLLPGGVKAQGPDAGDDSIDTNYPVVITPTRLRQSLADVPASVSIITAQTIRRYGITSIPDALRLVPGMAVSRSTGNTYNISYHGTYGIGPRRMNVLIDGVSAYRAGLAKVEWSLLPVTMEDIDRIEIIRGPDSAAYGPNSMLAVINILTKHPKDVERAVASLSVGSRGEVETTVRLATTIGPSSLLATASMLSDPGYDRTASEDGHDTTRVKRLSLRSQSDLADGSSLELQASYVGGLLEVSYVEPFQASHPDQRRFDAQVSTRWTKALSAQHELQVSAFHDRGEARQSWTSCVPQVVFLPQWHALFKANPAYTLPRLLAGDPPPGHTANDDLLAGQALAALSPLFANGTADTKVCGTANHDGAESRTQLEVQDTFVASSALRFVTGLGLRYQRADSETFFGRAVSNSVRWLFGHAEYRPNHWLTANLGGYGEANAIGGNTFSPRVALNTRLTDTQTVRAIYSEGTRTPDLFEGRGHWTYTLRNITPPAFGQTTAQLPYAVTPKAGVTSERIRSRELGYLVIRPDIGLVFDARLFDDELTHLMPDSTANTNANLGSVKLSGAEAQTTLDLASGWSTMLNYAYLVNHAASDPLETMLYSKHSGSIGVTHALPGAWRASLAYYGSSGNGLRESRQERIDLTLSRAFDITGASCLATLLFSYQDNPSVSTYMAKEFNSKGAITSSYNSRSSLRATVRLAF